MDANQDLTNYYNRLYLDGDIPSDHKHYLEHLKNDLNVVPKIIYDIGSAVLHWTKSAKKIWPDAKIIAFEAVSQVENFYKNYSIDYEIGVFTNEDNKELIFYEDPICLCGNSYYRENKLFSPAAEQIYNDSKGNKRKGITIDTVVEKRNFPLPDLIKIDVQGAELDILQGMKKTLKNVKNLIVELQHVEYNIGAKNIKDSIPFIESLGFELVRQPNNLYFSGNGPDADYHFKKII